VPNPFVFDFILMFFNKSPNGRKLSAPQTIIIWQVNLSFKPELGFTVAPMDMNLHSRLFAGKEEEPKARLAKYFRTHASSLSVPRSRGGKCEEILEGTKKDTINSSAPALPKVPASSLKMK